LSIAFGYNGDMTVPFPVVGLAGKVRSGEIWGEIEAVAQWLTQRGFSVVIESSSANAAGASPMPWPAAPFPRLADMVDVAIVLGGDGTMLHAAQQLVEADVPLIGVNLGRVGFLTDIPRAQAFSQLAAILSGEYLEERRSLLTGQLVRSGQIMVEHHALNDIVLNKGPRGQMIEFALTIDNRFVYAQRSDGIIFSTPTGSTAYALSANGPIVHPQVPGIVLVPLCPHTLTARPITVPDTSVIELALYPGFVADLYFDGHERLEMLPGDALVIRRANQQARFLHPRDYDYFAMLREKLHWSASPR